MPELNGVSLQLFNWEQIAAFLAASGIVATGVGWMARQLLSRNFVQHRDLVLVTNQVVNLEKIMDRAATKEEIGGIERRMRDVETSNAVLAVELRGLRELGQETKNMVRLMLENQLSREAKE